MSKNPPSKNVSPHKRKAKDDRKIRKVEKSSTEDIRIDNENLRNEK